MGKTIYTLTMLVALHCSALAAEPDDNTMPTQSERGRLIVSHFHSTLSGKLKGAMKEGGPISAIEVCNKEAQKIAQSLSEQNQVTVKRITDRVRNPADAPDAIDLNVLKEFSDQLTSNANAPLEKLHNGNGVTRYYKGIVIQPPCLVCHGENIAPSIERTLNQYYPSDQARGYKLGELRGAFVVHF
ncbi:DUF3365 domain-containing protein [Aurantivibrio plasticivorans]